MTGPDGVAVVQGLARERYLVWADAPGYQPARAWVDLTQRSASAGAAGAGEPARVTLSLTPYPQAYWVRLRAETASAGKAVRTGELVRVRATVGRTGSAHDDPARMALRLRLGPSLRAVPAGEAPKAYQVSADSTEVLWLWDPLQPGQQREFTVVAVRVAGAAQRRQAEISASVEQTGAEREGREGELPSAVLASATVRLALEPEVQRAVVMGRVVGPDGQGLEGAWVHWEGGAGVQTGPGGWFTLSVPAGPHRLWVTRGVSHSPQAAGTPPGGGSAASPDALTVAQAGSWVVAEPGGLVPVVLAVNTGGSGEPGPATGGGFTGQPQPTWAVAAGQLQWDGSSGADGWAGLSAATALGGLGMNGSGRWGPQGLEWAQVRAGLGSARVVYRSDGLASEPERPGSGLSVPEELSAHLPAFSDGAELEAAWAGSRGFGLLRWQGPGSGRPGETVWLSAWERARAGEWWAGAGRYPAAGTAQEYRLRWVAGMAGEKPRGYRLSAVLDGPEGNPLGQASGLVQAGVAAAPQAQGAGSLLARLSVRHGWGDELPRLLGPAADELDRLADLVAGAGQDPSGSYRRYTEVRLATTQQVTLGLRRAAAGPVQGTDRAAVEDAHADFYFQPGEEGELQAQEGGTAAASEGSWAQAPSRPLMRVRLGMLSVQG
ncbi:MAG TPA: hypothetical protein VIL11_03585, partial [Limnochordales bacterium]